MTLCALCAAPVTARAAEDAPGQASFLVLDLGGRKGADMIARGAKDAVYWDSDADGLAERCGWVGTADGVLALDRDNNGAIDDGSELFGSATQDGFEALAAFDMNRDMRIDARDRHIWPRLRVWRDLDGDGRSAPAELLTMAQSGVTALLLRGLPANDKVKGNLVIRTGKYEYSENNRTGARALLAVRPDCDPADTKRVERPDRAAAITRLPALPARGRIPSLHDAMGQDYSGPDSLMTRVRRIADAPLPALFAAQRDLEAEITALMLRWAGVDRGNPARHGPYIDARKVDFLNRATGRRTVPEGAMLDFWQAYSVEAQFHAQWRAVAAALLLQTAAGPLFSADGRRIDHATAGAVYNSVKAMARQQDKERAWKLVALMTDGAMGIENLGNEDGQFLDALIRDTHVDSGLMGMLKDALVLSPMEMTASQAMKGFLTPDYMTQENISLMFDYIHRRYPHGGMRLLVNDAATLNLQSCCKGSGEVRKYLADNRFAMEDVTARVNGSRQAMAALGYSMILQGQRIIEPSAREKKKGKQAVRYSLSVYFHGEKVDWAWAMIDEVAPRP